MQAFVNSSAPVKTPLSERLNVRILTFAGLVLLLIGYPVYIYLESVLSGGIRHRSDGTVEVDLKSMSSFVFDQVNGKVEDIPEKWRELNGKRVVLEGEMWAPNSAAPEIENFELVYSIQQCCFSGPPQIQHFVQSTVSNGGTVPFYSGLVRVVGTLKVDVRFDKEAGKVSGVYHLAVESVEPV